MQDKKPSPTNENKIKVHKPKDLDFSFLELGFMNEILDEGIEPREVGIKPVKPKRNADGKFDTRVVRLNNNNMGETKDLITVLEQLVVEPQHLTWVDLSFNKLTAIDPCICDLTELQILYLHSNQIAKIQEVDKLAGMAKLRKLSLHGNPVATDKMYKAYVLTQVRQLQTFDMTAITKADRATANTLKSMTPQKKAKKPKEE